MRSESNEPINIAIPLGTRLTGLAIMPDGEVHVWIANKDKSIPYVAWQGTFIRIETNGRITRVTRDDALPVDVDELVIRNADN